jgi:ethanolamine ammonia-lyase small subunit
MDKLLNHKFITLDTKQFAERDPWEELKQFTDARIALGRTGSSVLTDDYLKFSLAHARARDTIKLPFQRDKIADQLKTMGLDTIYVESSAVSRDIFIRRPDLGRRLSFESREKLKNMNYPGSDVLLVIGDGLSSKAVHKQAIPLVRQFMPYMKELGLSVGPIVLARQSRVALGDDIAEMMHCGLVAMLIGERPGLSSPDSLGVYMTYKPYFGRLESERNCISNIRPEGLSYEKAAFKLAWLVEAAYDMQKSGTALKDESDDPTCYRTLSPHQSPLTLG